MKITLRTKINWTKLVIASLLMCLMFSFSAMAQTNSNVPLDDKAVSALLDELKEGLPALIDDEEKVTAIIEKWDAREDLSDKTKVQILKTLFADVKAVVEDKETQDNIWKSWTEEEESDAETPVETPQEPVKPPVETPQKPVAPPVNAPVAKKSQTGFVKSFDEKNGFGYITPFDGGADIFFHYSEIKDVSRKVLENQQVEFELGIGPKGQRIAINIRTI